MLEHAWSTHICGKAQRCANSLAGLARTDNNMEFSTWPQVNMINQKNYYTYVATSLSHLAPGSL
jgi:hypothetical protein